MFHQKPFIHLLIPLLISARIPVMALSGESVIQVRSFLPSQPISRAERPSGVRLLIENSQQDPMDITANLSLPTGVKVVSGKASQTIQVEGEAETSVEWEITSSTEQTYEIGVQVSAGGMIVCSSTLSMYFLPPQKIQKLPYIPEPEPVKTEILVGAHNCPLWEASKPHMWDNVLKHPERTPALGFYSQENPEVADWETKWAVEHGVSFFIYCWYRNGQGGPVKMNFGSAIHEALFKSRFVDKMKYTIMWENQSRGYSGVSDEKDLMDNLMPFWIENYFKHPSYLKIDNKPVLFIYRPEYLLDDLGGVENVVKAFDKMREACKQAGFEGLYILGEYRGLETGHLELMKSLGLDYTFAYCWHIPNNPSPEKAIATQMEYIKKTQELGILPQVVTVSQAWSGWADEGSIWKIPPKDFKTLLQQAKDYIATFPFSQLGSKLLILDNWNEWGEGHYIAPYREFGFGYLDAVREVFAKDPKPHVDLIPEDIGMGPYDTAYQAFVKEQRQQRELVSKKVIKEGAAPEGLVGWWAFDESDDSPVALDHSGHRMGGLLHGAKPSEGPPPPGLAGWWALDEENDSKTAPEDSGPKKSRLPRGVKRTQGIDGPGLLCDGGCVEVLNAPKLSPATAMTLECWVKTDEAGQANNWIANRVFGGATSKGYRLGILEGNPCFEIPQSDWSHHLKAKDPLPTGRWVHLAGTFDGQVMRIYVDGELQGSMDRPGPINSTEFHLCLGNYEIAHPAYFRGVIDEVKLYDRALLPDEIKHHYLDLQDKAGGSN